MASAATVPSPPRQRVLTFAERQHLSDQRRAAVLAQRQAERAKRREAQASRRTANSASPGYDPTAYAARRAAAIADAKRAEAVRRRSSGRFADGDGPPAPVPPRGYFPTTPVTPSFPTSPVQQASPSPPPWSPCGNQISGAPRRRRDIVSVAASARWRGDSTSMAWRFHAIDATLSP